MSNVCAGLGRGQMEILPTHVIRRRAINALYRKGLSNIAGICFQTEPSKDFYSNYWLTSIIVDSAKTNGITREDLRLSCGKVNIETRPLWKPMHLQPVFGDCPFYGDGTSEHLFNNGLCLPSGSMLTDEQIQRVISCVISTIDKYEEM
jgi:dTDP-4-amino-4,6-dideoxygalactose transaminase